MLLANGIDPKVVGFKHDLLRNKYHHLYSIFADNRIREFGYDQSEAGKNEQTLAFLLAYQLNHKGPVMVSFVRHFLVQAKKKERLLRSIYFGVHSTKTVPIAIRSKVVNIYRNELRTMT